MNSPVQSTVERPMAVATAGLAQMLCVSERAIRKMNNSGRLPRPIRLGRSVRWRVAEIEAWLAAGAPARDAWEAQRDG
jgi:predicted DNA-binding transcriptional regulator AlpA